MTRDNTLDRIRDIIDEYDLDISICSDDFPILGSWRDLNQLVAVYNSVPINYVDYGRVDKELVLDEDKEFFDIDDILGDFGFSDEWICCSHCGNSIRTSLDSYSWMADYFINNGEIICGDCVRENYQDEYIEYLINNPEHANTILKESDMGNLGFKKCICNENGEVCDFESGFYGRSDNPKEILKKAISKNPNKEFIFDITEVSQFSVDFTIWSRGKEEIYDEDKDLSIDEAA